jgi:hypothetical protein
MKKVLSLLVAFVFLQVQTWALSGGPVYPGNQGSVKGTYAGTLLGQFPPNTTTTTTTTNSTGVNGLGMFALGVPTNGLGSGIFAFFSNGDTFYGSIVGTIDPDKLTLNALVRGQANRTTYTSGNGTATGTPTITQVPYGFASGTIVARLVKPTRGGFGTNNSTGFRVEGNAFLEISFVVPGNLIQRFGTLDAVVDGFQQSTDETGVTLDLSTLTTTSSSS